MKRSALKHEASKTKQQENITKYKKQWNLVVKLNRETKLQYFNNLETSKNLDKCRPCFPIKHAYGDSKIILIEKEAITTNTIIKNISNNKASAGDIPIPKIKQCGFTYHILMGCINDATNKGVFPDAGK